MRIADEEMEDADDGQAQDEDEAPEEGSEAEAAGSDENGAGQMASLKLWASAEDRSAWHKDASQVPHLSSSIMRLRLLLTRMHGISLSFAG